MWRCQPRSTEEHWTSNDDDHGAAVLMPRRPALGERGRGRGDLRTPPPSSPWTPTTGAFPCTRTAVRAQSRFFLVPFFFFGECDPIISTSSVSADASVAVVAGSSRAPGRRYCYRGIVARLLRLSLFRSVHHLFTPDGEIPPNASSSFDGGGVDVLL